MNNKKLILGKIENLQKKNKELREEIIQELGKINQEILLSGEIGIENPNDNLLDLTVEEINTEVISVSDGGNCNIEMSVANMDNKTLLSILSQVYYTEKIKGE